MVLSDAAVLEALPDAVLITDDAGRIIYANAVCCALVQWQGGELVGESVERVIPPRLGGLALVQRLLAEGQVSGASAPFESFALRRDGTEVAVDVTLRRLGDASEAHVIVIMRDVTRQRDAARRLKLLSLALDAAPSSVFITDASGTISWANPAMARMTGYESDELIGQKPSILKSGQHPDAVYAHLWESVTAGLTWQGLLINRRKDGSLYSEEQAIAPLLGETGDPTHFVAVGQDVSERAEATALLRQARDELARRVVEIEHLHAQLREQAIRDPLTSLFNRRYLDETLPREIARAGRDGKPLSLVVLDIDHFKRINDTHGHPVGDLALSALAKVLRGRSRTSDVACRFGGEEFVMVLPGSKGADACRCAEAWRAACAQLEVPAGDATVRFTFSAGVAEWQASEPASALLGRADRALYEAKHQGRDRVVAAPGA